MTIQTTDNTISHSASGSQQNFTYNFLVPKATDMVVYENGIATVEAYTVNGVGNPAGGSIDFTTYIPVALTRVTLTRLVPPTQLVNYEPYDPFPAETHEGALDKLTMITQQLQEELDRAFKFLPGSPDSGVTWEGLSGNADKTYIVNTAETGFIAGPTATEIQNAQMYATQAAASAAAASASASASASSAASAAASAVEAAASAAAAANTNKVNLIQNSRIGVWSGGDVYNWGSSLSIDNMSSDLTANWTGTGTLAFITNHYTLTHNAANARQWHNTIFSILNSRVIRVTAEIKNGTASGIAMRMVFNDGVTTQFGPTFITTGAYVSQTNYFRINVSSTSCTAGFEAVTSLAGNNIEIKNWYCIEIIRANTAGGNDGPEGFGRFQSTLNIYRDPDTNKAAPNAIYAIKTVNTLEQVFWPTGPSLDYTRESWLRQFRGRTVTFGAWVAASTQANKLRLAINDGVTVTYSPYVSTVGAYQWIEVTKAISVIASAFVLQWDLEGNINDQGYMAQPMLIYGNKIGVGNWVPRSDEDIWLTTPKVLLNYTSATVAVNLAIPVMAQTQYVVPFGAKAVYVGLSGANAVAGNFMTISGLSSYGIIIYSSSVSQNISGMGWVPMNTNGDLTLARSGTWTNVEITVHAIKY